MLLWIFDALVPAMALLLALAVDRWWGEPPAPLHPVVWMGRALGACGARVAPVRATGRDLWSFWLAALAWCALAAIVLVVCGPAVAGRGLSAGWGGAVAGAVAETSVGLAHVAHRRWWRWSRPWAVAGAMARAAGALVSRDVRQLDAAQVRESAIESLAENLNDSVVAPLFWFALLGLPGAALYRFANTADSMWGYRGMRGGRRWEWAGKWAARADDVLSWLPARLTASALLLAVALGAVAGASAVREARTTPIAQQRLAHGGDGAGAGCAAVQAGCVCACMRRVRGAGRRTRSARSVWHQNRGGICGIAGLLGLAWLIGICHDDMGRCPGAWWPRCAGRARWRLFDQRQCLRALPAGGAGAAADRSPPLPRPGLYRFARLLADFHGVAAERVVVAASASELIARITAHAWRRSGLRRAVLPAHGYGDYARAAHDVGAGMACSIRPAGCQADWSGLCEPGSPLGHA